MKTETAVISSGVMLDAIHRVALFEPECQEAFQRTLRHVLTVLDAEVAILSIGDAARQVVRTHVRDCGTTLPMAPAAYRDLLCAAYGSTMVRDEQLAADGVSAACTFGSVPLRLAGSGDVIGMLAMARMPGGLRAGGIAPVLEQLAGSLVAQLVLHAQNAELRQKQTNLELQKHVLSLIAEGAPLDRILHELARFIEHESTSTLCVIRMLEPDGRLRVAAAPTLPESLVEQLDGAQGPGAGADGMHVPEVPGMVEQGVRHVLSFPVGPESGPYGTIDLFRTRDEPLDVSQLHLVSVARSAARIAIDRRRAEAELVSSEIYHRSLIENSSEFILVLEADGTARYVSSRFARAVGRAPRDFQRFEDVIVRQDRERFKRDFEELISGREVEFELQIRTADGSIRHVLGTGTNLLHNPAVRGVVINARDVTQQKRAAAAVFDSEERYRLVARASSDLVWDYDVSTGMVVWPARDEPALGYESADLPRTVACWVELLHPDDADRVREGFATAIADPHTDTWSDEYRMRCADGSHAVVLDRGFIVRDERGSATRVIGSIMDLTSRRMLEEQLRHAQRMEAVGRLAGGIAHDFNNLLTVIEGFTALLIEEFGTEGDNGAALTEIQKASSRAAALTRQLLAFSRRQVLQPKLVDMNEVVRGMSGMLSRLIPVDVAVATELADDELRVHADIGQLEQVILNLVINAREAIDRAGRITIATRLRTVTADHASGTSIEPGEYVVLSVTDDGCGMGADVLTHIFEPFFTTKETGTGLGLATVYGIVEQTGGMLRVNSVPGLGSTFDVLIPAVVNPEGCGSSLAPPRAQDMSGGEMILVVEDDPAVRELTTRVLRRYGYDVTAAEDGPTALTMLERGEIAPDLLLTDVVLPHLNGPIVAERVKQLLPETAVVFMSGYTDEQLGIHGVLSADVAFIQKPFQATQLLTLIRDQLDARAADLAESTRGLVTADR